MFTGIVSEVGVVDACARSRGSVHFTIRAPSTAGELSIDKSVAVNGVCLTVTRAGGGSFEVDAVEETLSKTMLGSLGAGDRVNLELPMRLGERLDGHLVLGHVDAVGIIEHIRNLPGSRIFTVKIPQEFLRYCIGRGSIAIDGISLTIARISGSAIEVAIIPHTLEKTIAQEYAEGGEIYIEFELIGKYAEKRLPVTGPQEDDQRVLTEKHLREMGF